MGLRLGVVAVLCACVTLSGCRVSTAERRLLAWDGTSRDAEAVRQRRAPYRGEYRLYGPATRPAAAAGERHPLDGWSLVVERRLSRGQRVGFARTGDGVVVAVAGTERFPLAAAGYQWRLSPDADQTDRDRTALLVTVLVVGGIVALVIAAAAAEPSFNVGFGL